MSSVNEGTGISLQKQESEGININQHGLLADLNRRIKPRLRVGAEGTELTS